MMLCSDFWVLLRLCVHACGWLDIRLAALAGLTPVCLAHALHAQAACKHRESGTGVVQVLPSANGTLSGADEGSSTTAYDGYSHGVVMLLTRRGHCTW